MTDNAEREAPENAETSAVFEVTVPVTVSVKTDTQGRLVVTDVNYDSWGGFFSDAEDAWGVWDVAEDSWGHDNQGMIYRTARDFVQRQIAAPVQHNDGS